MANGYIFNQVPTNYGQALALLNDMLVAAGWTVKASGDGLAGYSASGNVFTNTGAGALGWNNAKAWSRLADPGGNREYLIQHDAAGGARLKYSYAAKFTGGSPSATVTPSATDEKTYRGGGTDATPTYGAAFFAAGVASGLVKFQGRADGSAPYGFWYAGAATPAGAPSTGLMMDPVTGVAEDLDPVVIHVGGANAWKVGALGSTGAMTAALFTAPGAAAQGSWAYMDVARTQFVHVMPGYIAAGGGGNGGVIGATDAWTVQGGGLAANPFNSKQEALPAVWIRPTVTSLAAPLGLKGWSTLMRWTSVPRTNFSDTLDTKNWICVGNVWLPWDGSTTPTN